MESINNNKVYLDRKNPGSNNKAGTTKNAFILLTKAALLPVTRAVSLFILQLLLE